MESHFETVTIAACGRCGRTGGITRSGAGFWCAWCGDATELELRDASVLSREKWAAYAVDGTAIDPEDVPLQPLRITAGWRVAYNDGLYEADASETTVRWWWLFKSSMLVLTHEERNRMLDVDWSPEMEWEDGSYNLRLYEGITHTDRVLHEIATKDRRKLVAEIERILRAVTNGSM